MRIDIKMPQACLEFGDMEARNVAVTPEIRGMIDKGAVVAIGISGGKDSVCCALAVARYLDEVGH